MQYEFSIIKFKKLQEEMYQIGRTSCMVLLYAEPIKAFNQIQWRCVLILINGKKGFGVACRIWCLNCGDGSWGCSTDIGAAKLHYMMAWNSIALNRCIAMSARERMTQLSVWICARVYCARYPIYLKVLLIHVRTVGTLEKVDEHKTVAGLISFQTIKDLFLNYFI